MKRHGNKKNKQFAQKQTDDFIELYEGLERLTDKVVEELILKGWPKENLLQAQKEGLAYNRIRNSLISRPEHSGVVLIDYINDVEGLWDGMK